MFFVILNCFDVVRARLVASLTIIHASNTVPDIKCPLSQYENLKWGACDCPAPFMQFEMIQGIGGGI